MVIQTNASLIQLLCQLIDNDILQNQFICGNFIRIKNTQIEEVAINSKTVSNFVIRMFMHDQLVEKSTYALNQKITKQDLCDELADTCMIRKRRNQDSENELLENKLLSRVCIYEQESIFDTLCIRGSFQEIANLLLECSNNLAFSSQPRVQYNSTNKQFTVSDVIWFNPHTYQSCAGWIMNELEKSIALMFHRHKQGLPIIENKSEIKEFWKQHGESIKLKLTTQLPQIIREIQNAPKKKKSQLDDILFAQLVYKLKPVQQIDQDQLQKLLEGPILDMQLIPLSKIIDVQSLCQRRFVVTIKTAYKERIMKDLIEIEQKEKSKQQKVQKKSSKKSAKVKREVTPSTASHKDIQEHKSLNIPDLIESLQNIDQHHKTNKLSIFTTPPNSPLDISNQILELKSQFSYVPQVEATDEDDDEWSTITKPQRKRKFSSQLDLTKPNKYKSKKGSSFIKQKTNQQVQEKAKIEIQLVDSVICSVNSQETDKSEPKKELQISQSQQVANDNQQQTTEESENNTHVHEQVIIEKQKPVPIQQIQIQQIITPQQDQQAIKQLYQQPCDLRQLCLEGIPSLEEQIDQAVMEQAQQAMIKKLDLDMRELNEQILSENEQILSVRQLVFNRLQFCVKHLFRECNSDLRLFGSCATGLALPESDIDIGIFGFEMCPCLTVPLNMLCEYLQKMKWVVSARPILSSNMPILKLIIDPTINFMPGLFNIEGQYPLQSVDLSFFQFKGTYQHFGLVSTDCTLQWISYYQELRPIVFLFKSLLKKRGLNDQYKGGISSFCVIQMVLAFLSHYYQTNRQSSLGMTTYKFLEFYADFDPQKTGIAFNSFFDLTEFDDMLELTIISPFTNEVVSQASSFVHTILQDIKTFHEAALNEVQFFYEKIKHNKKKKGKKEERNLFVKELNKLTPLFGS